jgi:hypothetical protein
MTISYEQYEMRTFHAIKMNPPLEVFWYEGVSHQQLWWVPRSDLARIFMEELNHLLCIVLTGKLCYFWTVSNICAWFNKMWFGDYFCWIRSLVFFTVRRTTLVLWKQVIKFVLSLWNNQQMRQSSSLIYWCIPNVTPTCFSNSLPSSGGRVYLRSYSGSICVVDVYGLQCVQCGQLSSDAMDMFVGYFITILQNARSIYQDLFYSIIKSLHS